MKIHIAKNNVKGAPRWKMARLPIKQKVFWIGPLFVLIQIGVGKK